MGRLVRGGSGGPQPEDNLFRRMPGTLSKASKVRILKAAGLIRQAGAHLAPTPRGLRSITRIRRRSKGV